MFHAEPLPAPARFAEDDQTLAGQNHFLDVVEIEPAQNEGLAEGVRIAFLQGRFEDSLAAAKMIEARLDYFAAETNRLLTFFSWEAGELAPVFVTSGIVREQVADRFDAEAAELGAARARDPLDLA